ncbi:proline dehydrogenase family protein [Mycobacterium sp. JS623]|uniref:proline dehydrogenase family protein n=1 Tax=Mycobacterium sp. JS623 TaxID=212767 RepID=UPI00059E0CEF|nr:proline dehydrogenase family protein [Mycobacterium sp. JS623]
MSELFHRVARPAILAASRRDGLRRTAERLPVTRDVVHRFVPGETVADAMNSVEQLRHSGRLVSIDYLGEDVTDVETANATVDAYLGLLDALGTRSEASGRLRPLEVSLKLSALGQALPRDGEKVALENAHTICERAQKLGVWVTVDAEDHTSTDSTLSIVRDLRTEFDWLGAVLQAYLKRTEDDCRDFAASGARIRLCKGAYDEPSSVAYRAGEDVTESYLRCLEVLMAGSGYPMVASHDPQIIEAVPALARENGRGVDDFEYQMLYGIRDAEQRRLADEGNHVRVYVPFGTQWYGYFVRRLAERPANLTFFLRALAERRH